MDMHWVAHVLTVLLLAGCTPTWQARGHALSKVVQEALWQWLAAEEK